eukprot:972946-Pleurochrysis_carterae.AAC.2
MEKGLKGRTGKGNVTDPDEAHQSSQNWFEDAESEGVHAALRGRTCSGVGAHQRPPSEGIGVGVGGEACARQAARVTVRVRAHSRPIRTSNAAPMACSQLVAPNAKCART